MVLVRGLVATATGWSPTGMIAVTRIAGFPSWTVLLPGDADAVMAVVAAPGANMAVTTVNTTMARWADLMRSCFLAGDASESPITCLHGGDSYMQDSLNDRMDYKNCGSHSERPHRMASCGGHLMLCGLAVCTMCTDGRRRRTATGSGPDQ
jgi:hypothetical protein